MSALAAAPGLEEWHLDLHAHGARREAAVARLHGLLLRAARFEVFRRSGSLPQLSAVELDELAQDAADDAAVSVLRRLGDFRGESSFRTWAYKFALLEAAVKVRRRAWRDREVTLEPEDWESLAHAGPGPDDDAENAALLEAVREGIRTALTPRQRQVLVAVVLEGVPIDVLAERLGSNRNALYKLLHDARRRLRSHVATAGFPEGNE
ncbi:MAG TPA: sigma-70 family RNA polymerase sigma factor [Gaiellaceae bacterium]|nr:sigma-70 family RNA polymerase sigma factor [Gaiellaceae bacterium]